MGGTIDDAVRKLDAFAGFEPPYPRWLGGEHADAGPAYCHDCAEKAVAEGKGDFVDGGWHGEQEDHCCHCDGCGRLLAYSLTSYGVETELEHFERRRLRPLSRDNAYHIARIVESAPSDPRAIRLADRAVAAIPPRARADDRSHPTTR